MGRSTFTCASRRPATTKWNSRKSRERSCERCRPTFAPSFIDRQRQAALRVRVPTAVRVPVPDPALARVDSQVHPAILRVAPRAVLRPEPRAVGQGKVVREEFAQTVARVVAVVVPAEPREAVRAGPAADRQVDQGAVPAVDRAVRAAILETRAAAAVPQTKMRPSIRLPVFLLQ